VIENGGGETIVLNQYLGVPTVLVVVKCAPVFCAPVFSNAVEMSMTIKGSSSTTRMLEPLR